MPLAPVRLDTRVKDQILETVAGERPVVMSNVVLK
jgi:hypothetical protein